jgi:NADH-quinone oxidoreductase subunit C
MAAGSLESTRPMSETTQPAAPKPPAPAAAPAGRTKEEILAEPLVADAVARAGNAILDAKEFAGEITVFADVDRIVEVCRAFKEAGFNYLVDLTGVDYSKYPGHTGHRFGVTYTLYSFAKNERVRIRVRAYDTLPVPSVTSVWKTANWHERETYDMFGIVFEGHPKLERILMWEGFNGFPLRKDFPIRGIDTGARIYPEVFPAGGGPKEGATGKDAKDVNLYDGEWKRYGTSPGAQIGGGPRKPAPELAKRIAPTAVPSAAAPWHDPALKLAQRMELATGKSLRQQLFAAMAQTDCMACSWDCEGYASALAADETKNTTLCIPGGKETEATLRSLLKESGKL